MDPTQLSNLLTESTNQLTNLHQQLGSSPSDVSSSIEALGKALRKAVDNQVDKCQKRVDEIRSECQSNLDKIQQLQEALREENETDENDGERGIDENMVSCCECWSQRESIKAVPKALLRSYIHDFTSG